MLYIFITTLSGTTPKNKSTKLSPGASNKKRKLTNTPKKEKKDKAKNINGTEIVENIQENDTVKSEHEREKSIPRDTKFNSDEAMKMKNKVKKKRARIIEPDSSDDDHLPVNLDHSKIDIFLVKNLLYIYFRLNLYICPCPINASLYLQTIIYSYLKVRKN